MYIYIYYIDTMFLIYDDLYFNIEIKCKYDDIIDKLFISKFINNINEFFIWASFSGHYKIVKLLSKNKRINPNNENNYAIRMACMNKYLKIIKLLLKDKRVDPSDVNNYAIRCAAENGYYKIVKLLLKDKRVDPSDKNNEAIQLAYENGYYKIIKLLLKDRRIDKNDQTIKNIINKLKHLSKTFFAEIFS